MCQAFATETSKKGWMVPVGVQAIPAVMILVLAPFTVESPRWLITHNRKEGALKALKKLRPKDAVSAGVCEAEIDALDSAIQQDKVLNNARWRDIIRGTYFRRAVICATLFWLYQTTGNSFYNAWVKFSKTHLEMVKEVIDLTGTALPSLSRSVSAPKASRMRRSSSSSARSDHSWPSSSPTTSVDDP